MGRVLGWIGPVTAANLASVPLGDRRLVVLNQGAGGIGSSHFRALVRERGGTLEGLGLAGDDVWLAGWSAGGAALDELAAGGAVDRRIRRVLCADGYYTMAERFPEVKPGWAALARAHLAGHGPDAIWWTTGATGGPGHLSSRESFGPFAEAFRLRPARSPLGDGEARVRRGLCWIDLPALPHVKHATQVAPACISTWTRARGTLGAALALTLALVGAAHLGKDRSS